ncbi:hypothetical protein PFISCL1PPCAC_6021, partial [Pristionchus fissidentatus]
HSFSFPSSFTHPTNMRELVKRRSIDKEGEPTIKKVKEEIVEKKPDVRRVKDEPIEFVEVTHRRQHSPVLPPSMDNNYLHNCSLNDRLISDIVNRFILIPPHCVGLVIGKQGVNIKNLRAFFPNVSITLGKSQIGLPSPLLMRGTRDLVTAVKEVVSNNIGIFGPVYESFLIHNYFKETTVTREALYSIDKLRLEKECVTVHFSEEDGSPTRSIIIHGNQTNVEYATSLLISMIAGVKNEVLTWRIQVPHSSVGRVIGKRHANIIETRKKSGARIELSNAKEGEDSSFRYFQVIGTRGQIDVAVGMITNFSGQFMNGSFLHTSYDSGFSSNSNSPKSMNNSLPVPMNCRFYG